MNHRYEERYFARGERDRDRERGRQDERGAQSRGSFYPGDYGSDDADERQSGSREYSQQYGQREPYESRGGSYGVGYGGEQSESRYSESQYGQGRYSRQGPSSRWGEGGEQRWGESNEQRWRQGGEPRWGRSGWGQSGEQDWSQRNEPRWGQGYEQRGGQGWGQRGEQRPEQGNEPRWGRSPFSSNEQPRYYGTGYYGEGGGAFGGGYGEERWRTGPSGYGQFRSGEMSRYGSGYGESAGGEPRHRGVLQRLFNRGPKGYQRSDERLTEDISERLMQTGNVDPSEVTVQVSSGKVTLEGTVPDRYMKYYIEDIVDACPGVQDIDNRIRVDRFGSDRSREAGASGSMSQSGSTTTPGSTTPGSTSSAGGAGTLSSGSASKGRKDS